MSARRHARPPPAVGGLVGRYLLRLLARPLLATLLVVLPALLMERLLRLFDLLAGTGGPLSSVARLLVYLVPHYLGLALPAALFIGVYAVVARLSEDREMDALQSVGFSLGRLSRPFLLVGLLFAAGAVGLYGYVQPLGRYAYRAGFHALSHAGWNGAIVPGEFIRVGERAVVHVDRRDPADRGLLRGIFVRERRPDGTEALTTAATGRFAFDAGAGEFILELERGQQIVVAPDGGVSTLEFAGSDQARPVSVRFPGFRARGADERELTLDELWFARHGSDAPPPAMPVPRLAAELHGRLVRAASLALLPLLAVPMGLAAKRSRRSHGIVLAAAILVLYQQALQLLELLGDLGRLDARPALWAAFALFAAFCGAVFRRSSRNPAEGGFRRRAGGGGAGGGRRRGPAAPALAALAVTLRRYLTRLFAGRTLLALLALVALLQLLDLLDRAGDVLARGGVADVAHYAALRLPTLLGQAVPLAVLVGSALLFLRLSATSEMAALRAAGVGAWRVLGALLPACALAAAAQGALLLVVAPATERALADWWDARDPAIAAAAAGAPLAPAQRLWLRNGSDIVAADAVSLDGARLEGVLLVRRDAEGRIAARIEARGAEHTAAEGWVLREASVARPGRTRAEAAAAFAWPDGPSPATMRDLARPTEAQGLERLLAGLRGEGAASRGPAFFATRVQAVAATLSTPFVMLLLAAPAAFGLPRDGGGGGSAARRAAVGLALGLGYLVAAGLLGALGEASVVPPVLAAWTAPFLFAVAGVLLLQREEG